MPSRTTKRILIACENSNSLAGAFRNAGYFTMSADLFPSPGNPLHYCGNVFDIINEGFDFMFAFPPCTYLCKVQLAQCNLNIDRKLKQLEAIDFVKKLYNSKIPKIVIENPSGILTTAFRRPDQIVHPYYFGDQYRKQICFWLKNIEPFFTLSPKCFPRVYPHPTNHTNSRMTQTIRSSIRSSWKYFPEMCSQIVNQIIPQLNL